MPTKQTKHDEPDWRVEYRTAVRSLLMPPITTSKEASIALLLWPSFHGETGIFVSKTGGCTGLEIRMLSSSYWYHSQHKKQQVSSKPKNDWPEPPKPHLLTESIALDEASAKAFWNQAADCGMWVVDDANNIGLDGMPVDVEAAKGSSTNTFQAWSPAPTSPQGRCVDIIFQLAWKYLTNSESVKRLEEIFCYIYDAIPKRDLPGPPRTLKIFGRLSSAQEDDLVKALTTFKSQPQLLVDMSNFEGMGTLLHPVFKGFAERDGRTAWVVNDASREHLVAAGVDAHSMFEDSRTAAAWLLQ